MNGNNKNRKEADRIVLQALPQPHLFRQWKLTVRKTIISASVNPKATWAWLLEGERDNVTFEDLYEPGDEFQSLDCKLCVAVDVLVKDNASLRNDIVIKTETLGKAGKMIAGRQVLRIHGVRTHQHRYRKRNSLRY